MALELTKREEDQLLQNSIKRVINTSMKALKVHAHSLACPTAEHASIAYHDWEELKTIVDKLWNDARNEVFRKTIMSHYDIHYSGNNTPEDKVRAIKDIKDYIGKKKFEEITEAYRKDKPQPFKNFCFQVAVFVGVQGYPAKVWFEHIYQRDATEAEIKEWTEDSTELSNA